MSPAARRQGVQQRGKFKVPASSRRNHNINSTRAYNNRVRHRTSNVQTTKVHRRYVLYPNVLKNNESPWLSALSWFSSIALKLFTSVIAVSDDLVADTVYIGSGSVILLGHDDYAAVSPFATNITGSTDKEVVGLRALPFERAQLPFVNVRIVPSVDMGTRGGMYAAVLIRTDPQDSAVIGIPEYLKRFDASYDTIIKHPNAKMTPANRSLSLSCSNALPPRDLRVKWDEATGFENVYPSYVLMVAFSDLAASSAVDVNKGYSPAKCLFEVHTSATLRLCEPGEVVTDYPTGKSNEASWVTCKTARTDIGKLGLTVGTRNYDVDSELFQSDGTLDIRELPLALGEEVLAHFNRADLLIELRAHHLSVTR